MREKIKLTDLIDPNVMQKIQDAFSHYTGMAALTTDANGVPVTKGSGFSRFCMEITRKHPKSCANCERCDRDGALLTKHNHKATAYTCHAGLCDFAAPIMLEGQMIGSFIGGQVRFEEVDERKLRIIAHNYGIDPDEYVLAARQTNCIPMDQIQKAADFLEEIAAGLSGMAYKHHLALQESQRLEKASKSQADFIMNISLNMEGAFVDWLKRFEGIVSRLEDLEAKNNFKNLYKDAHSIHSYIKDMLDYIKMSGHKIEIRETKYQINDLVDQIKQIANILLSGAHQIDIQAKDVPEMLFGDPGRIGQIVSKVIKILLNHNSRGHINVELSTQKISYATMLNIMICDKATRLSSDEIKNLTKAFEQDAMKYAESESEGLDFSFVNLLLTQMNGKIDLDDKNGDLLINISIPQLV